MFHKPNQISMSCFLVEIINPLMGECPSHIKNSAYFVERISIAPIHSNQNMSLNVVHLYMKVPKDETFALVPDELTGDPLLEEAPTSRLIISWKCWFSVWNQPTSRWDMIYDINRQEEGLPMSSPRSPVLANIIIMSRHQYWPIQSSYRVTSIGQYNHHVASPVLANIIIMSRRQYWPIQSSCASSTDLPDPLQPPVSIVHNSQ